MLVIIANLVLGYIFEILPYVRFQSFKLFSMFNIFLVNLNIVDIFSDFVQ